MATTYDKASLVMIPSGYKDDKLYSVKPTDGSGDFTFSRDGAGASPATRVNASGLIEKGRTNELTYSNDFSNAAWIKIDSTITAGQTDKDGGTSAYLLQSVTSAVNSNVSQTIGLSGVSNASVYAKAGTSNFLLLYMSSSGSDPRAWFDLSNGTIGTQSSNIDATIENVGGGWYRCSLIGVNHDQLFNVFVTSADNVFTSNSGDNIYIQDAQLESGLVATDYIETTTAPVSAGLLGDMPRLDYHNPDSPTPNSCPSLLLEPSRVNSFVNSEYFGGWTSNRMNATANAATSPEGVTNAYKLAQQSGFTTAPNVNLGAFAAGTYSVSIFAKAGDWNYLALSFDGVSYFNLSDGTKGTTHPNHTTDIQDFGNGWYRCIVYRTTTSVQTPAFYVAQTDNSLTTTDTQGFIYTYGAQLEASASYVSSYIPTYGSASTRAEDFCSKTGITSLIGQSEGAAYIEFDPRSGTGERRFFLQIGSGSTTIYARIESGGTLTAQILNSGTDYLTSTGTSISSGTNKFAVAYANNDAVFYLNGTQLATSSSVIVPALSALYVGSNSSGAQQIGGDVKQSVLFKTRLTNAELAAITSL